MYRLHAAMLETVESCSLVSLALHVCNFVLCHRCCVNDVAGKHKEDGNVLLQLQPLNAQSADGVALATGKHAPNLFELAASHGHTCICFLLLCRTLHTPHQAHEYKPMAASQQHLAQSACQ